MQLNRKEISLLKLKTLRIGLKRGEKMQTTNPAVCDLETLHSQKQSKRLKTKQ